ncbi:hypothetical protein PPYR_09308, partial [Photinus pyralis]
MYKKSNQIFTLYKPNPIPKPRKNLNTSRRNFHQCLKWMLLVAQCFGQIPVIGITDPSARSLQFKWKSWRTVYALLNCLGSVCLTGTFLGNLLVNGMDLFSSSKKPLGDLGVIGTVLASVAFHVNTMVVTLLFFNLSKNWPHLMNKWADVEDSMSSYGWPKYLDIRINGTVLVVLTVAI